MINIKIEGYEEAMRSLDPKLVKKAATAAVRDAAAAAKTETSRSIREQWSIKRGDLDPKLKVKMNNRASEAELTISGPPIALSYFGATQIFGGRRLTRGKDGMMKSTRAKSVGPQPVGVRVQIRTGSWTLLRRAWMRDTRNFAGRAKGGALLFGEKSSVRVLERMNSAIVGPKSISIASMFDQAKVRDKVVGRAQEVLNRRFQHHINRLLGPS